jgi:hypothetical protein
MNCSNCDTTTPALPASGLCPNCDESIRGKVKPKSSDPLASYMALMTIILVFAIFMALR